MNRALALLPLLTGCMAVAEETLLDELRVVSLRAAPPYVDLLTGAAVTATAWSPDPGARLLVWTCTPGGELACAEAGTAASPLPLSTVATVSEAAEVTHLVSAPASRPGAAAGPSDLPDDVDPTAPIEAGPPAFAWALACAPGLCPLLDAVAAAPPPGSDAWSAALAELADPFTLLEGLPKQGTAATARTLDTLLVLPGATAPANPAVTGPIDSPGPLTVAAGEELELTFVVEAAATTLAWPAATLGGFEFPSYEVRDGAVTVTLLARDGSVEESAPLEVGATMAVYVVFEAEDGGSALWVGEVTVR